MKITDEDRDSAVASAAAMAAEDDAWAVARAARATRNAWLAARAAELAHAAAPGEPETTKTIVLLARHGESVEVYAYDGHVVIACEDAECMCSAHLSVPTAHRLVRVLQEQIAAAERIAAAGRVVKIVPSRPAPARNDWEEE